MRDYNNDLDELRGTIDEQFPWHINQWTEHFGLGAFFSCYTIVNRPSKFILQHGNEPLQH